MIDGVAQRPSIVCIHGLGGSPASLGRIPEALREAGYHVAVPTLPGHDTDIDHLGRTSAEDWRRAVREVVDQPIDAGEASRRVVLIGQSLGGVLALLLAGPNDPSSARVAGVVSINAPVQPIDPDVAEHLAWLVSRGTTTLPVGEPDIADPSARDRCYDSLPVRSLSELATLSAEAHQVAPTITVPTLVVTSDHDGTVDPDVGARLADRLPGAVRTLRLPNSRHVACLDLDRELLIARILEWIEHLPA